MDKPVRIEVDVHEYSDLRDLLREVRNARKRGIALPDAIVDALQKCDRNTGGTT